MRCRPKIQVNESITIAIKVNTFHVLHFRPGYTKFQNSFFEISHLCTFGLNVNILQINYR
jgi:hypothetical protein